jgi:hypothetical protein
MFRYRNVRTVYFASGAEGRDAENCRPDESESPFPLRVFPRREALHQASVSHALRPGRPSARDNNVFYTDLTNR